LPAPKNDDFRKKIVVSFLVFLFLSFQSAAFKK